MKPFTPEELAAFIDAAFEEVVQEDARGYVLKDGEFTVDMYCEGGDIPRDTAYGRLKKLIATGRLQSRKEKMNGRATNIYWFTEAL